MSPARLITRTFTVALLLVWLAGPLARAAEKATLQEGKIRVLIITGGHGFEPEPFFALFDSIADVQATRATYPEAAELLKPALANDCDVIVFYDMWAKGIAPEQQKALVELLQQGIGVVALHHALAAHQAWPEYAKILGGKYYTGPRRGGAPDDPRSGFLHGQDIPVHIADEQHPITRGIRDFTIHDETYNNYDTDPAVHVLLTTDHPKSDPELAWVHQYGNSRVFYMQLGHDHFAYENPNYRLLVARAIRWAAGRPADPDAPARELFNGRDLTGWQPVGKAEWKVENGVLVGQQGPGNTPGDLLTKAQFGDFEVAVEFQVRWPANSGVWYRYQSPKAAYQADILEYKKPEALTGTIYRPGKLFLAINNDPKTIDREGWNTLVIRAVGNHHVVFLNGTKVAEARDDGPRRGRIGFQVHPGEHFGKMQIRVRRVALRPI